MMNGGNVGGCKCVGISTALVVLMGWFLCVCSWFNDVFIHIGSKKQVAPSGALILFFIRFFLQTKRSFRSLGEALFCWFGFYVDDG
jgi:hypothetical protein